MDESIRHQVGSIALPLPVDGDADGFELVENNPRLREFRERLIQLSELIPALEKDVDKILEPVVKESTFSRLKEENEKIKSENKELKLQLETFAKEKTRAEEELKREETKSRTTIEKYCDDIKRLEQSLEAHKREQPSFKEMQDEMENLREERDRYKSNEVRLKQLQKANEDVQQKLQETQIELRKAKEELENTTSRLSRAMGDRLTDNNPNIADLSDTNRPTKISERYQELYDNQWSDAFEKVNTNTATEEKTVSTLFSILMDTVEFCKEKADMQMKQIKAAFGLSKDELPLKVHKLLKECRKELVEISGKEFYLEYDERLKRSYTDKAIISRKITSFVKECFEICWLMVVLDPPLSIHHEHRFYDQFNSDMYRTYTDSGSKIRYVVWPPLLLHKDGPVLCKGVAQGNGDNPETKPHIASTPSDILRRDYGMDEPPDSSIHSTYDTFSRSHSVRNQAESKPGSSYEQTIVSTRNQTMSRFGDSSSMLHKPTDHDLNIYFRWTKDFGHTKAAEMMGSRYDICLAYLDRT